MSGTVNRRSISSELKAMIQEKYPKDQERIIDYLEVMLVVDFGKFKNFKGYTPNENFLKIQFLNCFRHYDIQGEIGDGDQFYFSSSRPYGISGAYRGCLRGVTSGENFPSLSPLALVGSDGGGGDYFASMSTPEDNIYHVWEEWDGIAKYKAGLSDLIKSLGEEVLAIYHLYEKEFLFLIADHRYQPELANMEVEDLTKLVNLAVGLTLENSEFMRVTQFDFSLSYFQAYLENQDSDYYHYDNVKALINSQLISSMEFLYHADQKEVLKKLISLRRHERVGRTQLGSFLRYYLDLLKAEPALREKIQVNFLKDL